jgi:hypothetical protein
MRYFSLTLKWLSLIAIIFVSIPAFASKMKVQDSRLRNARELLGGSFKKKVIRKGKEEVDITDFVTETTKRFLPKKFKSQARDISNAIVNAAEEYDLDPVFLMAVAQNESSFNPSKVGTVGEIGLMQILPSTAQWISGLYSLEYRGPKSLHRPETNIWIGAALIDKLRHQFESEAGLYISAYNLGPKKVRMMLSEKRRPKAYVNAVLRRYLALYNGYKSKGDAASLSQNAVKNVMMLTN